MKEDNVDFKLDLEDTEILLTSYKNKLTEFVTLHKDILEQYTTLCFKVDKLNSQLSLLRQEDKLVSKVDPEYPIKGSWNEKITFMLTQSTQSLLYDHVDFTANFISEGIAHLEEIELGSEEYAKIKSGVFATLSMGYKGGRYKREKNENGEYFYMLNEKAQ